MQKIEVYFTDIGYSKTQFTIFINGVRYEFTLYKKSINDICEVIQCWLKAFVSNKLTFKNLKFSTSSEIYTRIQKKTLLNEKSVCELFNEKGVNIKAC